MHWRSSQVASPLSISSSFCASLFTPSSSTNDRSITSHSLLHPHHQLFGISSLLTSLLLFSALYSSPCSATILRGVTIESLPFMNTADNSFTGYCVDLMDQIASISGLNYSLYLVEDNAYGPGRGVFSGNPAGLIGDLLKQKADFAIADLTVTQFRSQYVQFTEPFFTFSFSALLRRDIATNLHTLDDLAIKSNITIGTYLAGNTLKNMQALSPAIRTIRWLYNRTGSYDHNLVWNEKEALERIRNSRYAFIQEEPKNAFLAKKDCSLALLRDQNYYMDGKYAIAFRKDSPYVAVFNQSIAKLERSGKLADLRRKYFQNYCPNSGVATVSSFITVLLICTAILNNKLMF